jgi:hypothetical protein
MKRAAGAVYQELSAMNVVDLVTRITLLLLILRSGYFWYLHIPMVLLCTVGLVYRTLYRNPRFWLVVCLVLTWGNLVNWYQIDNHKYLMMYWCIALYLGLQARDPESFLRVKARLLIGLCFAFATLWKFLSLDYIDGTFFEFTLIMDPRFDAIARPLGGLTPQFAMHNDLVMGQLMAYDSEVQAILLEAPSFLKGLASGLTWWTLAIEGLLAVLFLLPDRLIVRRAVRDVVLIAFALTTYTVATVVGFGWLLMIMGMAQLRPEDRTLRLGYFVTFLAIQVFTAPWDRLLFPVGG